VKRRSVGLSFLVLGMAILCVSWIVSPSRSTNKGIVRIGVNDSPPFVRIRPDGTPEGFSVSVLSEAARRRGMHLEWIVLPEGPDSALQNGRADVWPLITDLPERHRYIYFTDPWLRTKYMLLAPSTGPVQGLQDTPGRRIAYRNSPIMYRGTSLSGSLARRFFPKARLIPEQSGQELVLLCRGESDAEFIEHKDMIARLLRRPPECDHFPIRVIPVPGASYQMAIGANARGYPAAKELRAEITSMAQDQTLDDLCRIWLFDTADETKIVTDLTAAEQRSRLFRYGAGTLTLIIVCLVVVVHREHRAQRTIRSAYRFASAVNDQLAHRAHHDALTGLPNRLLVESELESALREAADGRRSLALLFLDIDRFKQVNDSLGHLVGDAVLAQIAARLIQSIPPGAMAARIGGDEFMVILKHQADKDDVEQAARRIIDEVGVPLTAAGSELYPHVSLGISMFPQDGEDAVTLQRRADLALYRAKSRGKNRYEFFSQEIGDSVANAIAMEQCLRKALEGDWLELYYQAQFSQLGKLVGMEALVRLRHPIFGLVGPSIFIALAEETGLIHRLGEWVLREACRQIRCWQDAGFEPVKVAINVSALQFRQLDFAESVGRILGEMRVDPRLIELELTESMIMGDYDESALQMQKLRSLGVSIAVDDFGTGHCSLAHLHRLPIDVLKIDQSFVREMDSRSCTWSLVQAIVAMAHNLKLTVVGEGVETECQRSALDEIGCDCLQGYGLHRPQPAFEIEQCLLSDLPARISLPVAG
jgi:diguanylate cyclase (GGDEF)-like protein